MNMSMTALTQDLDSVTDDHQCPESLRKLAVLSRAQLCPQVFRRPMFSIWFSVLPLPAAQPRGFDENWQ